MKMAPKVSPPKYHSLVTPNYNQRSPVVNDNGFTDKPTIGSPSATWNPAAGQSPLPNGPPRNIDVPGKRPNAPGLTNKRITQTV